MNPLVKLAVAALPGTKSFVLFVGAGVSKDAGLPTAWDLMLETAKQLFIGDNPKEAIPEDFGEWFTTSEYAQRDYSELIGELYPTPPQQQTFLENFLGGRTPGRAHELIAELAKRDIIRCIITPNFDHCLEDALAAIEIPVQVISTEEDLQSSDALIQCKKLRIYKYNGDLGKGKLKNSPKDIESVTREMKGELIRVLGDHGVLVLGFAGRDPGAQELFKKRNHSRYPVFWADPQPPHPGMVEALRGSTFEVITISGASNFLDDLLNMYDALNAPTPGTSMMPSVDNLKRRLEAQKEPNAISYSSFLDGLFNEIKKIQPIISNFENLDDAIFSQIESSVPCMYAYTESARLASRYDSIEILEQYTGLFERLLSLCDVPLGFNGSYYREQFDGYKFLLRECLVVLVATLLEHSRWNNLVWLNSKGLVWQRVNSSDYVDLSSLDFYLDSIDVTRNRRILENKISLQASLEYKRFKNTKLADVLSIESIFEADYYLFLRSILRTEVLADNVGFWRPLTAIYVEQAPMFLVRARSSSYLDKLAFSFGITPDTFVARLSERYSVISRLFSYPVNSPITSRDIERLGEKA